MFNWSQGMHPVSRWADSGKQKISSSTKLCFKHLIKCEYPEHNIQKVESSTNILVWLNYYFFSLADTFITLQSECSQQKNLTKPHMSHNKSMLNGIICTDYSTEKLTTHKASEKHTACTAEAIWLSVLWVCFYIKTTYVP